MYYRVYVYLLEIFLKSFESAVFHGYSRSSLLRRHDSAYVPTVVRYRGWKATWVLAATDLASAGVDIRTYRVHTANLGVFG